MFYYYFKLSKKRNTLRDFTIKESPCMHIISYILYLAAISYTYTYGPRVNVSDPSHRSKSYFLNYDYDKYRKYSS